MHINKVHHVTTINRIAEDLGEDEDWLRDVANEMEIEDGVIWVYGVGEDGVMAFTDFGIETLMGLIKMQRKIPNCSRADRLLCGLRRMVTQGTRIWMKDAPLLHPDICQLPGSV